MVSYQKQRFDPPKGDAEAGRWQVHISVTPEELAVLRARAGAVVPLERLEFHTELLDGGGEGDTILAIRVDASTAEDAISEACRTYGKLREASDLPPETSPPILGYLSPWWRQGSVPADIAREAHELHRQGRHELAVMRIQTACELRVAETLGRLLTDAHPDADIDRILRRPTTLADRQTQALAHMLTGQSVQQTSWWPAYSEHLKRRNSIAHRGLEVTRDEASASLRAAIELHAWLLAARGVDLSDLDLSDDDPAE
jgi:hypothetical protein